MGFLRALLSSFVLLFNSGRANQTQDYIDFYFIVMNKGSVFSFSEIILFFVYFDTFFLLVFSFIFLLKILGRSENSRLLQFQSYRYKNDSSEDFSMRGIDSAHCRSVKWSVY